MINNTEEILKYWGILEFLSQDNFPDYNNLMIEENVIEEELIEEEIEEPEEKEKPNRKINKKKTEKETIILDKTNINDKLSDYLKRKANKHKWKIWGNLTLYVGEIRRDVCIDYIANQLPQISKDIERHPDKDDETIALFSLKLDNEGKFISNSFSLSPIIWAADRIKIYKNDLGKIINTLDYTNDKIAINDKLEKKKFDIKNIFELYERLVKGYVENIVKSSDKENILKDTLRIDFVCYESEETKNKYLDEKTISLDSNFYIKDIGKLVLAHRKQNCNNFFSEDLIDYINVLNNDNSKNRFDLLKINNKENYIKTLNEIMSIDKMPIGKWPSRNTPAFMQQVAINLAFDENKKGNIFSIDGPPGTGKTTLIKELIVEKEIEKCIYLANFNDPNNIYNKAFFKYGDNVDKGYSKYFRYYYEIDPRIADYSVVIVSNSNAACENISKELPKSVLNDLKTINSDSEEKKNYLSKLRDYFDIEKSKDSETIWHKEVKDIYFTQFIRRLYSKFNETIDESNKGYWGLISAPLGSRKNISYFYYRVILPLMNSLMCTNDKISVRKDRFKKAKEEFLDQVKVVEKLKKELANKNHDYNLVINLKLEYEKKSNDYEKAKELNETRAMNRLFIEKKTAKLSYDAYLEKCNLKYKNDPDYVILDDDFVSDLLSKDSTKSYAQLSVPWINERYNFERTKLFYLALKFNKEFVLNCRLFRNNMHALGQYWGLEKDDDHKGVIKMDPRDKLVSAKHLLQSLTLLVPCISSTFASIGSMYSDCFEPGMIGTLIVDEAGQASPQQIVGALYRSKKAIIIGDPNQVEPIEKDDLKILKETYGSSSLKPYKQKGLSAQTFGDELNKYGTYLNEIGDYYRWVGSPLLVHRRCISPMFEISNYLSYNGIMKKHTKEPSKEVLNSLILDKSCWINVNGNEVGNTDHFVKEQADKVIEILEKAFGKNTKPNLFIITPFTTVKNGLIDYINKYCIDHIDTKIIFENIKDNIGTIHSFQGKEANEVIVVLGCDESLDAYGAIRWVNKNIVNVAVSRAKYALYMIGDYEVWKENPNVAYAKEELDSYVLEEMNVINNSDLPKEEKEEKLIEKAKEIPSIEPYVKKINEEEYEINLTEQFNQVILNHFNGEVSLDKLNNFGFKDKEELNMFDKDVRNFIINGINTYYLYGHLGKLDKNLDLSSCSINFCKAFELYAKEILLKAYKKYIPNCIVKINNKTQALKDVKGIIFTIGNAEYVLKQYGRQLGEAMRKYNKKLTPQYFINLSIRMEKTNFGRNNTCHPSILNYDELRKLINELFIGDKNKLEKGLFFELRNIQPI